MPEKDDESGAEQGAKMEVGDAPGGGRSCRLSGRLDVESVGRLWRDLAGAAPEGTRLVVDAEGVTYCDVSGAGLLLELRRRAGAGGMEVQGLKPEFAKLLAMFKEEEFTSESGKPEVENTSFIEDLGRTASQTLEDMRDMVTFTGELAATLWIVARRPSSLRWRDALLYMSKAGTDALGLVGLIGFLMGVIMAFQGAVPMQMFGVDIYVADLVVLAMLREMGALMTAILLAGRTGSAFAAEIGTMKVNEEVNALTTMGLSPVRFLVVTRVLAGTLVTPPLTMYASVIGIFGGGLVMMGFGHTPEIIWNQMVSAGRLQDLFIGLSKSFVFGLVVSAVGCMRGLQTKSGPTAVGDSTTRAVVTGILLIVILDGIFSVVFYYLNL